MGKRELVALLNLSSWCLVMVERLFLVVPQGCLRSVVVVFPDFTLLLFLSELMCALTGHCVHPTCLQLNICRTFRRIILATINLQALDATLQEDWTPNHHNYSEYAKPVGSLFATDGGHTRY